jgi:hypothetical protein
MDVIKRLIKTEITKCPLCYKKYKTKNKYQHNKSMHHKLTEKAISEYKLKIICKEENDDNEIKENSNNLIFKLFEEEDSENIPNQN